MVVGMLIRLLASVLSTVYIIYFTDDDDVGPDGRFIAVWVGKVVNQGDGSAPAGSEPYVRYERGLKAASLGLVLFAVLTGMVSLALPRILHRFQTKRTLAAAQVMLCLCFSATFLIPPRHIYLAAMNIAWFGIPWAVFLILPWALVAQLAPPNERGLYLGVLNIFAVIPQILVSLSGPIIVHVFGEDHATQAALGFGGKCAIQLLTNRTGLDDIFGFSSFKPSWQRQVWPWCLSSSPRPKCTRHHWKGEEMKAGGQYHHLQMDGSHSGGQMSWQSHESRRWKPNKGGRRKRRRLTWQHLSISRCCGGIASDS